jgi:hypothetical protein
MSPMKQKGKKLTSLKLRNQSFAILKYRRKKQSKKLASYHLKKKGKSRSPNHKY